MTLYLKAWRWKWPVYGMNGEWFVRFGIGHRRWFIGVLKYEPKRADPEDRPHE